MSEVDGLPLCACETYYKSHHPECPARLAYERQQQELAKARFCGIHQYDFGARFELGCPHCATIVAELYPRQQQTIAERDAEIARLKPNAERYCYLVDDLAGEQRGRRNKLLERMAVMGKGAVDAAIDTARREAKEGT